MEIWKHRKSWIGFVLFLLAVAVGGESTVQQQQLQAKKNCTYAITIETTCAKGAETSNHISLRFGDTRSNDILVRHLNTKHPRRVYPLQPDPLPPDDVQTVPFRSCTTDEFLVTGRCIDSPVCYLYLKLEGNDDWRPGFAQVQVMEHDVLDRSSGYFYFRRFLPRKVWYGVDACDGVVTPFGVKYKRKVFVKKQKTH